MAVQLTLNFGIEQPKKRIRYLVPNYIKFYSLYQYDRIAFKTLMKEWLKTEEGKSRTYATLKAKQDEILNQCYILDEDGNRLRDSDSKHIFRIQTLYSIYQEIYRCIVFFNPCFINVQGMLIDTEEKQAEIDGTCYLPIKDRVIIHIRLLRLLRSGLSIKEALCKIKG